MSFERKVYTKDIYAGTNNPYASWLEAATEKTLFEEWLRVHVPMMKIATIPRTISILDMGCSWGSTSLRFMKVLTDLGIHFRYTGVDPYQEQLDKFSQLAQEMEISQPQLIVGDAGTYVATEAYDLVLASHMLYYTSDMQLALENSVAAGREVIIVHHGKRGINTVHEAFREDIKPGPHIISVDEDVAACFKNIDLGKRVLQRYAFPSSVDVSSCIDPNSQRGQNLLSFFFEREYETIPAAVLDRARTFFQQTYAPDYRMIHDVGIFVVT